MLAPESGPEVQSPGLAAAPAVEADGRRFAVIRGGAVESGGTVELTVRVPETIHDVAALSLGRAALSIELDDTVLEITHHQHFTVAEGAHLAGSPEVPLLRFDLPPEAELEGVSTAASSLGITGSSEAIEVLGPLAAGDHEFAFRYRLPVENGVAHLELQFPLLVPVLAMQIADTGVIITSDRMHRLRPEASGTRMWLREEAFHVRPEEAVSVRFEATPQAAPSRAGSMFAVFSAAALAMLFVARPLRVGRAGRGVEAEHVSAVVRERDIVYATIRDLDHDFETGKIAEADYTASRAQLRARAIELLRIERQVTPHLRVATAEAASAQQPGDQPTRVATGRFCPACGGTLDPSWRFCSHCGGELSRGSVAGGEPAG